MTAAVDPDVQSTEIISIPSMLTNSYRAIAERFGDAIIDLNANGSITTPNPSEIQELREYGLTQEQETNHRIELDYSTLSTEPDRECSNPLDTDAREAISQYLNRTLDTDHHDVEPDLSVTQVTVRVTCEPLQEITAAETAEFDFRFVADPAEDAVRQATRRLNSDRGLYTELGFNVNNLNLYSVVESATKLAEQTNWRCWSWEGPETVATRTDERLAVRINEHVLPDDYGTLKPYRVEDDQIMDVVAEKFDELDEDEGTEEEDDE